MLRGKQFAALVFLSLALGLSYSLWLLNRDFAFVYAADRGDMPAIHRYLAEGVRPDAHGVEGMTAIKYASLRNNTELVRLLLNRGVDPGNAIYQATARGNCKVVAILLNAGARMDPSRGELSLRNAARSSDITSATVLLHHSVDINCKEQEGDPGFTPLLLAARFGSWPMFKFLVDRGANITARTNDGKTALMLAERSGNPDKGRICNYLRKQLAVSSNRRPIHTSP